MRLTPRAPNIPDEEGFTTDNDLFGRKDFGERLADLIGNIDEELVIVLDGDWGSGKTVFARQWAGLLRSRGAPVIYFDAFANDHQEDGFLALSAEVYGYAKSELGGQSGGCARQFLDRAKAAGSSVLPLGLRVASRAATAGLLSLEDIQEAGEAAQAAVKALGDESARSVQKLVSERLRKAGEERAALQAFRDTLSQTAAALADKHFQKDQARYPLVVIIDELDRCRPPFAVDLLERIKHLFSVRGVCFLLVTNLQQLEAAVCGAYGEGTQARTYLDKFFHLRISLPEGDAHQPVTERYVNFLWEEMGFSFPNGELDGAVRAFSDHPESLGDSQGC